MKRPAAVISGIVCYTLAVLSSGVYDAMGREGRLATVAAMWIGIDCLLLWAYRVTRPGRAGRWAAPE